MKAESGVSTDMWVGTRSAWHSKNLEQCCQTAVCRFPIASGYYTKSALIRTNGLLYTCC